MKKSTIIIFIIVIIIIVLGLINLVQSILRYNYDANHIGCLDNCKRIGSSIEKYAAEHNDRYPECMSDLVPDYLKIIPDCPSKKQDTYSESYKVSKDRYTFTFYCSGHNHFYLDFPIYTSNYGEQTSPYNKEFSSPLLYAIRHRNYSSVEKLIKRQKFRDDVMNSAFYESLDAFSHSNTNDRKDVALLLLKNGVNVNQADEKGNTWLHLSVVEGKEEEDTTKFLLDKGANPAIKNKEGKTPLDFAIEGKNQRIIDLLKSYKIKSKKNTNLPR